MYGGIFWDDLGPAKPLKKWRDIFNTLLMRLYEPIFHHSDWDSSGVYYTVVRDRCPHRWSHLKFTIVIILSKALSTVRHTEQLWSICAFSKCFHTHMNALSNGKSSRILWESSSFWAYLFCQVTIMFVCLSIEAWSSSWEKSFYCYHRVRLKRVQDLFKVVFMPHNQFINWENGFKWDCFIVSHKDWKSSR